MSDFDRWDDIGIAAFGELGGGLEVGNEVFCGRSAGEHGAGDIAGENAGGVPAVLGHDDPLPRRDGEGL